MGREEDREDVMRVTKFSSICYFGTRALQFCGGIYFCGSTNRPQRQLLAHNIQVPQVSYFHSISSE